MKYFLSIIFVFWGSIPANAQISLPEFSLSINQGNNGVSIAKTMNMAEELSSIKSPLFRDMLILQNQINLLEGLIERQSELQSIAINYKNMGLAFKQPAPPRSICEQLPVNILCLLSYPDLKINQYIVQESQLRFEGKQRNKIAELLAGIEQNSSINDSQEIPNINRFQPMEDQYSWSDIQCLNGKCSALLVNSSDSNDRIRVKNNQKIDGQDMIITSITKSSVMALIEGKKIEILPLSIGGSIVQASNTSQKEKIADILKANLGGNISNITPNQQLENTSNIPEIDLGGMLGPTGLF